MEGQGHLATEARGGLLGLGEINSMRHPEYRDTNEPRPDPAGLQWTRIRCQTIGRESTQQLCTEMPSFAPYRLTMLLRHGAPGAFSMEQLRHRAVAWSSRVRPSSFCCAHILKCSAQAASL